MRFSATPTIVVEAIHSSTGSRYSLRQFKTLFGVSPNPTAMAWEYMLAEPDTLQKEVVLQDFLLNFKML